MASSRPPSTPERQARGANPGHERTRAACGGRAGVLVCPAPPDAIPDNETREAIGDCAVYPRATGQAERLLRIARIERLFYEIRYELDNRPDWIAVPLGDLRAAMEG